MAAKKKPTASMSDDAVDAWFKACASYTEIPETPMGMSFHTLSKKGAPRNPKTNQPDNMVTVGLGTEGTPPPADPSLVKRFLVRWYVGVYGE